MSEIKAGAILNYISLALRFSVGFFLSPFILKQLGPGEYGVYMIAGTIISWLALCDFGLTASTTKFLSEYRAKGDDEGEAHYLGNVAALFTIVGIVVLAVGLCLFPFLGDIFDKFSAEEMRIYRILYLMTLFNCALLFPARSLEGIAASRQKFKYPGLVGLVISVLSIIGTVSLLHLGFRSITLTTMGIALGVLGLIWNVFYCFYVLKARMTWRGWDWPLCRTLFAFSIWMFLDRLINIMNTGSGGFIIGMTQGAEEVTVYSYGLTIFQHFYTLSGCIAGLFLPKVVGMVVNGANNAEQTNLMIRIGRVQLIILALVYFGIILFGQEFFHLWVGDTLGARTVDCWFVTVVILIPYGFLLLQALGWQILQARNAMKFRVSVLTITSFLSLIAGYFLSLHWGCRGLALGSSISVFLGQGLFMNWFYWRRLGLEIPRFFSETLQRAWFWGPALFASAWGLNYLFDAPSWPTFFVKTALFSIIYTIVIYYSYSSSDERRLFFRKSY